LQQAFEKEFDNADLFSDDSQGEDDDEDQDDDEDDDQRSDAKQTSVGSAMEETENPLASDQGLGFEPHIAPKRETNRGRQIGKKQLSQAPVHVQAERRAAASVGLDDDVSV
jgi:hypothetical protein